MAKILPILKEQHVGLEASQSQPLRFAFYYQIKEQIESIKLKNNHQKFCKLAIQKLHLLE